MTTRRHSTATWTSSGTSGRIITVASTRRTPSSTPPRPRVFRPIRWHCAWVKRASCVPTITSPSCARTATYRCISRPLRECRPPPIAIRRQRSTRPSSPTSSPRKPRCPTRPRSTDGPTSRPRSTSSRKCTSPGTRPVTWRRQRQRRSSSSTIRASGCSPRRS